MAQQSKKPSLADPNVTASEYLMFTSPTYEVQARISGDPELKSIEAGAAFVPGLK